MSFTNYINDAMINHQLDTESSISIHNNDSIQLYGGSDSDVISNSDSKPKPNGGFPPIYYCKNVDDTDEISDDSDNKARQYISHKNSVSIKDIIDKRKSVTPFISLSGIKQKTKKQKRKNKKEKKKK